ncbi:MAG: GDSL-type esterase/lipase family protein [Eubacteriales bacterium]
MKRIMVYGDANCWGFSPSEDTQGQRYDEKNRWPSIMRSMLGMDFEIIEENMCGRTTVFNDPFNENKNGLKTMDFCLMSHSPLDLIIIMLGTSDLKCFYNANPIIITRGLSLICDKILAFGDGQNGKPPKILVISPVEIEKDIKNSAFGYEYDNTASKYSKELKQYYNQLSSEYDIEFLAASDHVRASDEDSIHLTPQGQRDLAAAVASKVKEIFNLKSDSDDVSV